MEGNPIRAFFVPIEAAGAGRLLWRLRDLPVLLGLGALERDEQPAVRALEPLPALVRSDQLPTERLLAVRTHNVVLFDPRHAIDRSSARSAAGTAARLVGVRRRVVQHPAPL